MAVEIIPQPSMEDDMKTTNEFRAWLRTLAKRVNSSYRVVREDAELRPIFDRLCGAIMALRLLESSIDPENHIHKHLFRNIRRGEPEREIVECETEDILINFFVEAYQQPLPDRDLPSSETDLLKHFITTDVKKVYYPAWHRRWETEDSRLLNEAIQSLDSDDRSAIEQFYFSNDHPAASDFEIASMDGTSRREMLELIAVPLALLHLAATDPVRVICQRLGLVTQPETKSP